MPDVETKFDKSYVDDDKLTRLLRGLFGGSGYMIEVSVLLPTISAHSIPNDDPEEARPGLGDRPKRVDRGRQYVLRVTDLSSK
jgi:hypothetical protein